MYHVKEEKRCHDSCMLIYNALLKLLETMDINDITIINLSKASTVARATFYRNFDSIIDVLIWASDTQMDALFENNHEFKDIPAFSRFFYGHWCQNSSLLEVLIKIKRSEIFLSSLEKSIYKYSTGLLPPTNSRKPYHRYVANIWTVVIWSILNTWIINGKKETGEQLAKIHLHNMILPD